MTISLQFTARSSVLLRTGRRLPSRSHTRKRERPQEIDALTAVGGGVTIRTASATKVATPVVYWRRASSSWHSAAPSSAITASCAMRTRATARSSVAAWRRRLKRWTRRGYHRGDGWPLRRAQAREAPLPGGPSALGSGSVPAMTNDGGDKSRGELSQEEYLALSDQKAQDWRWISSVNPTMFGTAGALLAVGVTQQQAIVVALSPLPLFLSVWHMLRSARLQLQQITYLDVFAPVDQASWERDLAVVRERFWREHRTPKWAGLPLVGRLAGVIGWLRGPVAWTTWLIISVVIAIPVELLPLLVGGFQDCGLGLALGLAIVLCFIVLIYRGSKGFYGERANWVRQWRKYQKEQRLAECQRGGPGV